MKLILPLITSIILALWVTVIAIISVQNATVVSLKFLNWESIQMPVGVVLAISASLGLIVGCAVRIFNRPAGVTRYEVPADENW